jgi:HD-GYP domain-containing protein (c-di-GMP phosphodiesterase class II)
MENQLTIPLYDIVASLSYALDLVSPRVVNHHQRVAYFASSIALEMGLGPEVLADIVVASLLHDAGAISLHGRLDVMNFEIRCPHEHAERGYLFVKPFAPFLGVAKMIRHHHVPWEDGHGAQFAGEPVLPESQLLHLADRIDVLIDRRKPILGQVRHICLKLRGHTSHLFLPDALSAFLRLSRKECFWLDAVSPAVDLILARRMALSKHALIHSEMLEETAALFSRIIDFRSRYTAMHSGGVGVIAEYLAKNCGMTAEECRQMKLAGLLHDLGKLSVPKEILEKPSKLSTMDLSIVRAHTFHTYRILERIKGFENICRWAAYHHERLDGSGYPFHISGEEYNLGCRIVSVADVFTAITEDRPYRLGMSIEKSLKVLGAMVKKGKLDGNVVGMVQDLHRELNILRDEAQERSFREFEGVMRHLSGSDPDCRWGIRRMDH